jgi:hypothetical protein
VAVLLAEAGDRWRRLAEFQCSVSDLPAHDRGQAYICRGSASPV